METINGTIPIPPSPRDMVKDFDDRKEIYILKEIFSTSFDYFLGFCILSSFLFTIIMVVNIVVF